MKRALGLLMLGLAACASMSSAGYDMLPAASRDLQCPVEKLDVEYPEGMQKRLLEAAGAPFQAVARGCGKRYVYARMCSADRKDCGWHAVKKLRVDQLLTRAGFDLRCPKAQLQLTQLEAATLGVNGCGQQATYVWSCPHSQEFFSGACNWVQNSDARTAAPPPAP